jgi:carbon monoxide dehydrogenase subunit G
MAEGSVNVSVGASADEVWKVAGDFGGVDKFFPGIESFRLEDDDRVIGMFGMEVRERLLSRDDEGRTLTYSVIGGVPVDSHRATISVEPEGAGCKVTWSYAVEPDEMAPIFGDTYQAALNQLESGFS